MLTLVVEGVRFKITFTVIFTPNDLNATDSPSPRQKKHTHTKHPNSFHHRPKNFKEQTWPPECDSQDIGSSTLLECGVLLSQSPIKIWPESNWHLTEVSTLALKSLKSHTAALKPAKPFLHCFVGQFQRNCVASSHIKQRYSNVFFETSICLHLKVRECRNRWQAVVGGGGLTSKASL